MKIGYPCINTLLDCKSTRTFRLGSYSKSRFIDTVKNNLACLRSILEYNLKHNILFFRISSDIIPFASHPICNIDWQNYFCESLNSLGKFIKRNNIRVSMHPDQFTLINSLDEDILQRSQKELNYHANFLQTLGLDNQAKIQIHVGGVYSDKDASIQRFLARYKKLDSKIQQRLVIENDHNSYTIDDCLAINKKINIPVVFDVLHHRVLGQKRSLWEILAQVIRTWHKKEDGLAIIDYSSQKPMAKRGVHIDSIDLDDFGEFIKEIKTLDFDIMLEIKDKQNSALKAIDYLQRNNRFL